MALKAERAAGTAPSGWPNLGAAGPKPGPGDVDESFDRSMAAFSRQLAARLANSPAMPVAEPEEPEEEQYGSPPDEFPSADRSAGIPPLRANAADATSPADVPERPARDWSHRPYMLAVAFGIGALAAAGGLYLFDGPSTSAVPPQTVSTSPPPVVAAPAPAVQPPPAPPLAVPSAEATAEASIEPPAAPVPPPRDTGTLDRKEILEVQSHLATLGLKPGPLDGVAGPRTVTAIKRYEESKGQPQTGNVDRETLKRLREATRP